MDEKATMKRRLLALSLPFGRRGVSPAGAGPGIRRLGAVPGWIAGHALQVLTLALIASVVAFAVYYYVDRQVNPGASLAERQIAALETAVTDDPGSLAARLSLAQGYEAVRNYHAASEQYRAALAIDPESVQASLGLGRTQQATGDLAGAAATFEKVVEQRKDGEFAGMDNFLRDARYYLGEIHIANGDFAKAADSLEAALLIDTGDADAFWRLCEARNGAAEYDKAIEACGRAVRLVPNFTEAYQQMARAYEGAGQTLRARYANAMVSFGLGDFASAISQLQSVVREDQAYWDAFVGLGMAHEAAGEREPALAAFQQALSGDPENMLAQMGVARLGGGPPPGATGD